MLRRQKRSIKNEIFLHGSLFNLLRFGSSIMRKTCWWSVQSQQNSTRSIEYQLRHALRSTSWPRKWWSSYCNSKSHVKLWHTLRLFAKMQSSLKETCHCWPLIGWWRWNISPIKNQWLLLEYSFLHDKFCHITVRLSLFNSFSLIIDFFIPFSRTNNEEKKENWQ